MSIMFSLKRIENDAKELTKNLLVDIQLYSSGILYIVADDEREIRTARERLTDYFLDTNHGRRVKSRKVRGYVIWDIRSEYNGFLLGKKAGYEIECTKEERNACMLGYSIS